jgi:arylsulfatase A-like enzyme
MKNLILIAMAVLSFSATAEEKAPPRNVLFIAVDDLKPVLGCYGDAMVKSPNIDRLGDSGVVFTRAYCQQAVCGPSRASIMTGLRPDKTKVWDLKTRIRAKNPDIVTMPQYFRTQGYATAGTGKIFDPRSVDKQLDAPSWSIPFSNPVHIKYEAPGKPVLGAYHSETARKLNQEAKAQGLTKYKDVKTYLVENDCWPAVESADVPDGAYTDGAIANDGIRLMKKLKEEGQPFFLAVGFKKPHLPFVAPKKYWDLYDRDAIEIAPFQKKSSNPVEKAYHTSGELRSYSDIPNFNSYSASAEDHLSADQQKELIHGYYACTSYIDALVGQLMAALKEQGLDQNTVIVLWGDHGWHLGDHGLWCKHSNFEQATRVPLIVHAPGQKATGPAAAPVEFVDLFPTLCELAGISIPENIDGKSLAPILEDTNTSVKEYAVSQWPAGSGMGYAIRDGRYRYVEWIKNGNTLKPYDGSRVFGRELYDYEKDPLEKFNVVDDPDYADTLRIMQIRMQNFFEQQQ